MSRTYPLFPSPTVCRSGGGAGHRREPPAHVRGHAGQGLHGGRRRLPHHLGVRRLLHRHDQRARLDLHRAGHLRLLAARQGAGRRAAVRRLRGAADPRAAGLPGGHPLPVLPHDALPAEHPGDDRDVAPRRLPAGAAGALPQGREIGKAAMLDLILRNATLPSGATGRDIAVKDGRIVELRPQIDAQAREEIDAGGHLVTPPFVDSHFHMDATLSLGLPRLNQSGTLLEGITLWGELKPDLTVEALKQRALALCRWSIARGTLAIRSHVDICDDRLLAVDALLEVRATVKPWRSEARRVGKECVRTCRYRW